MSEYHKRAYEKGIIATTSGEPESFDSPAPGPIDEITGQHTNYWVLSEAERGKGFIRPVRQKYQHTECHTITHMGLALSETWATDIHFYGATFCCACGGHYPVNEFVWVDNDGEITTEVLGS